MRNLLLASSLSALLAISGTATAQTGKGEGGQSAAPSADKGAPASGKEVQSPSAPKAQKQEAPAQKGAAGETGNKDASPGKAASEGRQQRSGDTKDAGKAAASREGDKTEAQKGDARTGAGGTGKEQQRTGETTGKGDARREGQATGERSGTADRQDRSGGVTKGAGPAESSKGSAGTGASPGASGTAAIHVSPEKKREVQTIFAKHRGQAVADANIRVAVGVAVPRTITLMTVPEEIVVIVPEYRRYRYFIVGDTVCIVDPETYVVVDVITLA